MKSICHILTTLVILASLAAPAIAEEHTAESNVLGCQVVTQNEQGEKDSLFVSVDEAQDCVLLENTQLGEGIVVVAAFPNLNPEHI